MQLIAVEPTKPPYISQGIFHPHHKMGTAPGFVPEMLDRDIIDDICLVSEAQAFEMCRSLARKEGLSIGISSGAVTYVASQISE